MSKNEDIEGKESSKRYWAKILIINGLVMCWMAFIFSTIQALIFAFKHNNFQSIPDDLIYLQLITGFGTLGLTLGERFNRKKDEDNKN